MYKMLWISNLYSLAVNLLRPCSCLNIIAISLNLVCILLFAYKFIYKHRYKILGLDKLASE